MTKPLTIGNLYSKQSSKQLNDSISSYESIINQLSPQQSKFCSAFIENWELFQVHVSSYQVMHTPHLFGANFVTYRLKVVTDHIFYHIDKRYRDFLELYNTVLQFYTPKTLFPKKTHLRSKVCPFLTESRRKSFDDFLSQIISLRNSNKSIISQLIIFLDLKKHYNEIGLTQKIFQISNATEYLNDGQHLFGHFVRHELLKIQLFSNQSLRYLHKIQNLIASANKSSIKIQDLRVMLVGGNKINGLIQNALNHSNYIVGLTFFKFIHKLLNIQCCPYAQIFRRILQSAPLHIFSLVHQQLLENEQFQFSYFQLVNLYIKLRSKHDPNLHQKSVLKEILKSNVVERYMLWQNQKQERCLQIKRKTKLQLNGLQKLSVNKIKQNAVENQIVEREDDQQKQQYVDFQQQFQKQVQKINRNNQNKQEQNIYVNVFSGQKGYMEVSKNHKFIHISMETNKNIQQIREIVKNFDHNNLITCYYPKQNLTNISKMFISFQGKQQKFFQFQQHFSEESLEQNNNNKYRQRMAMKLKYPKIKTLNSFYFYLGVVQTQEKSFKIEILYYFNTKRVKKLFQQQTKGKSSVIWSSTCNAFLQKKQNSSFGSVQTVQTN